MLPATFDEWKLWYACLSMPCQRLLLKWLNIHWGFYGPYDDPGYSGVVLADFPTDGLFAKERMRPFEEMFYERGGPPIQRTPDVLAFWLCLLSQSDLQEWAESIAVESAAEGGSGGDIFDVEAEDGEEAFDNDDRWEEQNDKTLLLSEFASENDLDDDMDLDETVETDDERAMRERQQEDAMRDSAEREEAEAAKPLPIDEKSIRFIPTIDAAVGDVSGYDWIRLPGIDSGNGRGT